MRSVRSLRWDTKTSRLRIGMSHLISIFGQIFLEMDCVMAYRHCLLRVQLSICPGRGRLQTSPSSLSHRQWIKQSNSSQILPHLPPTTMAQVAPVRAVFHILITVEPSRVDEYLSHLWPLYKQAASEPECTRFEVSVRRDKGEIRLNEAWSKDEKWVQEVISWAPASENVFPILSFLGAIEETLLPNVLEGYRAHVDKT